MSDNTKRNTILLERAVLIPLPPAQVFEFLTTGVPTHYRAMARGHERFDVIGGGPLAMGSIVDCRERAGNQEVHHRYVVRELEPGRRLQLASTPSTSFVHLDGRTIEGKSDTVVTYELAGDPTQTRLHMTIAIAFASRWQLFVARVLGRTAKLWGAHQAEELERLSELIAAQA
ncbi:MAG TPA: SRPBCC family protein [Enhygromyxa sp.]|nr:SRPBCC family protein [Enhygromyxa sp.]